MTTNKYATKNLLFYASIILLLLSGCSKTEVSRCYQIDQNGNREVIHLQYYGLASGNSDYPHIYHDSDYKHGGYIGIRQRTGNNGEYTIKRIPFGKDAAAVEVVTTKLSSDDTLHYQRLPLKKITPVKIKRYESGK